MGLLGLVACSETGQTIKAFDSSDQTLQVGQEHTQLVALSSAADDDGETVDISNSDPASVGLDTTPLTYAKGELQKSVKITGKTVTSAPVTITFKLRDRPSSQTLEVTVGDGDGSVGDTSTGDTSTGDTSAGDTSTGDT